jgi:two-component system capsular synthesis sensor histidine kinase RcsC
LDAITGCILPRVLVVDDNSVHRVLLQEIVTDLGGRVHQARDGHEAVEFGGLIPFDLILMDLAMPGVSGEEATQALRARGVECPIFAMTAHVPQRYHGAFPRYGFDGLIEKPFSMGPIVSALQVARAFAADGDHSFAVQPLRFGDGGG